MIQMTIVSIGSVILGVMVLIGGIVAGIVADCDGSDRVGMMILAIIVSLMMIIIPIVYSRTESGKRALKDQQSNFGTNQAQREITVYDINGNIIEQYKGKFDIETDRDKYILFDDENGKRHIIYYTTGTVIINEN